MYEFHTSLLNTLVLCATVSSLVTAATPGSVSGSDGTLVKLSYGAFQGSNATKGLTTFLGIPFTAPPKRFQLPHPPKSFDGVRQATSFGAACPLQNITMPPGLPISFPVPVNQSEDCLFVNVFKPKHIPAGKALPVLFYIYGGGFEIGDTSQYAGSTVVNRSIALGKPVIYVSASYRVNAFGFLGGKEVKEAGLGNAGLHDQIAALEWVQAHISKFGGDPKDVTIWGESAGAISVGLQMVINYGNPRGLFSGAIMQSGSPCTLPEIQFRQRYFDFLANATNCSQTRNRLKCLQEVPYDQFLDAVNQTPNFLAFQSINLAWIPMVDGKLIVRDPLVSLQYGKYAKIPFITGDAEDEGTLFSSASLNLTTNEEFLGYVKSNFLPDISDEQLSAVASAYPEDPSKGSPFHTADTDAITPEFKRIAAFQGDFLFQGPRRFLLGIASKTQPTYAFRYLRGATAPVIGSLHGGDLAEFFGSGNSTDLIGVDSVVFFANNKDPNAPKGSTSILANITWDKWSSSSKNPPLLTFLDPPPAINITSDTYRQGPIELLTQLLFTKVGRPW